MITLPLVHRKSKFDEDFPPLIGGNKNQKEEKSEPNTRRNNLSSRQAPATPSQPPASPPAASQAPASHLLAHPVSSGPSASLPAPSPPSFSLGLSWLTATHLGPRPHPTANQKSL
ncbi:hypothetical protein DSO57_1000676 [Entomophthora muscae]|uniref:Uncharacterized protein n=1 Tax=Entomophthora muscae TaxID=34485 RepID=A0ACC2TX22_9FUNG|nr:hypothetical protein DSO57_1000676 [Entomophthora muscae]